MNLKSGQFVKIIVSLTLAVLMVASTFAFERYQAASETMDIEQKFSSFDFGKENVIPANGLMRFNGEGKALEIVNAGENNDYVFKLNDSELWGNFAVSDSRVNIVADSVVVIPNKAQFDLKLSAGELTLDVYNGDVYLGFLDKGIELKNYEDFYSGVFMNRLLVPRDSRVNVKLSKIDERFKELLPLKMAKEFQSSAIPSEIKSSDWVKGNLVKDKKYIENLKQNFLSDENYLGAVTADNSLEKFILWVEESLTFVPEKKKEMAFKTLFASLNSAISFSDKGDTAAVTQALNDFSAYLGILPLEISDSEDFYKKIDEYIKKLSVFAPGDDQYQVLEFLRDKKFAKNHERDQVLNDFWLDIYKAMDKSKALSEKALDTYYKYLDQMVKVEGGDKDRAVMFLSFQNQLFDNLFIKYSLFYKDGYFAIKNTMEQSLLKLYPEGQPKEELRQSFISVKFSFLKRLVKFFFDDQVSVDEAKAILSRLVSEIRDLMPANTAGVAVIQLFETELNDIASIYGYLNSPEYYSSKTYGLTQEERYQSYLRESNRIWSFIDIQEDVLGDKLVTSTTVADVENAIIADFEIREDVHNVHVGDIKDVGQRFVDVSAVISGYPFEASYDRDYKLLKDVKVYGELISDQSVTLENLLELITRKFAGKSDSPSVDGAVTAETNAERAARNFIADKIGKLGFTVTEENVTKVDNNDAIYRVKDVYLQEFPGNTITFDYVASTEKASNVFLKVDGNVLAINESFALEELAGLVSSGGAEYLEPVNGKVKR